MLKKAAEVVRASRHTCAFTGAGISVESGIPPFRGKDGLWSKFDPVFLDIEYFRRNPEESWKLIKQIFYDFFSAAEPNQAHFGLAELEKKGLVKTVITQNIDNLHQRSGSRNVIEFHGNSRYLVCLQCGSKVEVNEEILATLPPYCSYCSGLLKPDFVFFGEQIPPEASHYSFKEAEISDAFLIIGTTGQIQPASSIPFIAKERGSTIIEINVEASTYTDTITDIFLQGKASRIISQIVELVK